MSAPTEGVIEAIRDELHATIDRVMDRWPAIAELRCAPDRERVECERRAGPQHQAGIGWLHHDPTGDQAFNPAATWQTDLRQTVATLGRLDLAAQRMIEAPVVVGDHCPVCGDPIGRRPARRSGANRYHAKTCYKKAENAGFKPARW